jgi:hypothetical protein
LETGYGSVVIIQDVPEAARFRDFVLDAMAELPEGRDPETDELPEYADDVLPWELREGGHDE